MLMCDHWEGCDTTLDARVFCYVCGGKFCGEHAPVREDVACACSLRRPYTEPRLCRRKNRHRVCDQCWEEREQ
jgi:hypothetical protein